MKNWPHSPDNRERAALLRALRRPQSVAQLVAEIAARTPSFVEHTSLPNDSTEPRQDAA